MDGFFHKEERPTARKRTAKNKSNQPRAVKKYGCADCGLDKQCLTPKMKVTGHGLSKILVVAEAPGKSEDEKGTQLIGRAGQTIRNYFTKHGLDLDKDCWKTNAVICRPPSNRTPTNKEINSCRPNLIKTIKELQPYKILLLGDTAVQSFLGDRMNDIGSIGKWVGWTIPDQEHKCWVFPAYHPQYLNYNKGNRALKLIFNRHIKTMIEWDKPFPEYNFNVNIITEPLGAMIFLESLLSLKTPIAIDFETTGIKPHKEGHSIRSIAISASQNEASAFPIFYDNEKFMKLLKRVLINKKIGKIAQNLKYEDTWSKWCLGYHIKNWMHDTIITSHVLDNRSGITGLKFQGYVNYGLIGYENEVSPYLKTDSKNSNDINNVYDAPLPELLKYNGLDAILTRLLFFDQTLSKKNIEGNNLLLAGQIELSKIESNGIHIDSAYYEKQNKRLLRKMKRLEETILNSTEAKKWKGDDFNFNSDKKLRTLLFDILKYKPVKKTASGAGSVDQSVLESFNKTFTDNILQWKKLHKIQNTYLANFIRETVDGYMRPNYNLNLARSYRSSSSNPNFQNIPVRDEYAQKITRSGIIPRDGRQLLEVDYSQIEVRIAACATEDPELIRYIHDPSTDMHRDTAMELLFKEQDEVSKFERYQAKNQFVFPQFYGDWFKTCATSIWNDMHDETREHLKSKGIKNYNRFENHVKEVERKFWHERFPVYNKWKDKTWTKYERTGRVELMTGFVCSGNMKINEVLNRPIQGPAFHCLLWSLIQLNQYMRKEKFDSLIIGQIHDSILMDAVPDERADLFPVIRQIMCEDIREHWSWIIVPLDIEAEITEIDQAWSTKKEIEI